MNSPAKQGTRKVAASTRSNRLRKIQITHQGDRNECSFKVIGMNAL